MKKVLAVMAGAILFGAGFFALNDSSTEAAPVRRPVGTYQCAICGLISKVGHPSTVLNERDLYGDGHYHDWRYIGGVSGSLRPIR